MMSTNTCTLNLGRYKILIIVKSSPANSTGHLLIPLSDMPILGSSNSAVNENMMLDIWTNGDTVI